jgi:hypothetical protein
MAKKLERIKIDKIELAKLEGSLETYKAHKITYGPFRVPICGSGKKKLKKLNNHTGGSQSI